MRVIPLNTRPIPQRVDLRRQMLQVDRERVTIRPRVNYRDRIQSVPLALIL